MHGGITHELAPESFDGVRVHAGEDGVLLIAPLGRRVLLDEHVFGTAHAQRGGHATGGVE